MTLDQFTNAHLKDLRQRVADMFHRMDWNGDGKLSLDEYTAPERARFEAMDRDATGVISCSTSRTSYRNDDPARGRQQSARE